MIGRLLIMSNWRAMRSDVAPRVGGSLRLAQSSQDAACCAEGLTSRDAVVCVWAVLANADMSVSVERGNAATGRVGLSVRVGAKSTGLEQSVKYRQARVWQVPRRRVAHMARRKGGMAGHVAMRCEKAVVERDWTRFVGSGWHVMLPSGRG